MADTKTLTRLDRLPSSPSGNPSWRATFSDGSKAKVKQDSTLGFEISPSWEGRDVRVSFERGVIVDMAPA